MRINPKKEPPLLYYNKNPEDKTLLSYQYNYLTWVFFRYCNKSDQVHPNFFGWKMNLRNKQMSPDSLKKTVVKYLPPINAKVTDYNTIDSYLVRMQKLADEANMPYVNLTLDVGAAMPAYKVIMNHPKKIGNVMIHLGDFHFMKENFGVIGKLVTESGFEDVIFQAGVCSSGSLQGVLAGSHYNRAWIVHSAFSEALERLLFERFLEDCKKTLPTLFFQTDVTNLNIEEIIDKQFFFSECLEFKEKVRSGDLGKTPQFWLLLYIDLMEIQNRIHLSVQENDYDSRKASWKSFLPMYPITNKFNYLRYGAYYNGTLDSIDQLYPGNKELLSKQGLSVQSQDHYPLRTSIDQRGEQTLNRDAKVAGGLTMIANDKDSIFKWTLNRAEEAKNTSELLEMAEIDSPVDIYKALRPSTILKSELFTKDIVNTLNTEYINPFGPDLDKKCLYNLSSGVPVNDDLSDNILKIKQTGKELLESFVDKVFLEKGGKFHDPIKRQTPFLFASSLKSTKITKNNITKTIEFNRNMLGNLITLSSKKWKAY